MQFNFISAAADSGETAPWSYPVPGGTFQAIISLEGACQLSTARGSACLIPRGCGQVIVGAAENIQLSFPAGPSRLLIIDFPRARLNRLQNQYLLVRDFMRSAREGRSSHLFPFPRIVPEKIRRQAAEMDSAQLTSQLGLCFMEALQEATGEWQKDCTEPGERYDALKLYQVIQLLLSSPDQRRTTGELARTVQMNEFRLKKDFKQKFKMSLHAFQENIRIEKAKAWVQDNREPLSRIASELGYSSLSHFSAAFKKGTGIRPNFFRSQQKQADDNASEALPA